MPIDWKYMPVLKWKRGERAAMQKLFPAQRQGVVPLAELQRDSAGDRPTVADLVEQLKVCLASGGAIGIDTLHLSLQGERPLELLAAMSAAVQKGSPDRRVLPVIHGALASSLAGSTQRALDQLHSFPEVILRLRTDQIIASQIALLVEELKSVGIKRTSLHLVVDQFSMVGREAPPSATAVMQYLDAAIAEKCLSVTLAGGSFPIDLTGRKKGTSDLDRVEWLVWEIVRANPTYKAVRFADYAVTNPSRQPEIDPREVNPSISIRYAMPKAWRLFKGGGFKKGKPHTLSSLCELLVIDAAYSGAGFSDGDKTYANTAVKKPAANGIPWTWRRDATNHHIALTAAAL